MYDEIRQSRKSLKQRRKELRRNVERALEARDFHAARQFMLDAGYEDGDPEMQRLAEIWKRTFES